MPVEAVQAFVRQAKNGLYLPPDLAFCSANATWPLLQDAVADYHTVQPTSRTMDQFADVAGDAYLEWRGLIRSSDDLRLGELLMMTADLASTYTWIMRGLLAAVDVSFASLMERKHIGHEDEEYPRLIPGPLLGMADVPMTVDFYQRMLTMEPWVSWLERLRAQCERTRRILNHESAANLVQATRQAVDKPKKQFQARYSRRERHQASRSIRRAIALFERLFGSTDDLERFLSSYPTDGADRAPLIVQGRQYDIQLTKAEDTLIKHTVHLDTGVAPMYISVWNKAGVRLCEVCLYFRDTPLIDQVITIKLNALNAQAEMEMLKAAHVMEATKAFYADPVLPELKGLRDPLIAPVFISNVFLHARSLPEAKYLMHEAFRQKKMPLAFRAFKNVMQPGPNYLPMMRRCAEHSMWDYAFGVPEARVKLRSAQQILAT